MALTKIKLDSMITGTLPDANIPDNITITNLSGTNTGDQTLPTASTLSGTTLKSTVVTSSLTSVGTLGVLNVTGAQSGDFLAKLTSSNAYGLYVKTVGTTTSHDLLKLNDNTGTVFRVMATGETTIAGDVNVDGELFQRGAGKLRIANKTANAGWTGFILKQDTNANLDINYNNGSSLLNIAYDTGNATFTGALETGGLIMVENNSAEHLRLKRNGSHWWDIQVGGSGSLSIQKNSATDDLVFTPVLNASSNATFGGDILPSANNSKSIGSTSNRFNKLHIDSILFHGDTAVANELDDYEEGTFTGTWSAYTSAPTSTATNTMYYTKIGNQVTCWITFSNKNLSGASGQMKITGLPFTHTSVANIEAPCSTLFFYGLSIDSDKVQTFRVSGNNTILEGYESSGGAWDAWDITAGTPKYLKFSVTYFV